MKADPFDGVGRFVDKLLDDPTDVGLAAALEANPGAGRALIDYLESRFVALDPMSGVEETPQWWTMLEILAATWGAEDKAEFLRRIGLRLGSPDGYRWVASFFREVFPVAEIEPWLLRGIEEGDARERENASHLAYHLFDGTPGYRLSPEGQARLSAADPHPYG